MSADRVSGIVTLAVSLLLLKLSMNIQGGFQAGVVDATGLPIGISIGGILMGIILTVFAKHSFKPELPNVGEWVRIGYLMILMLCYAALLENFGFILSTLFFMFALYRLFGCGNILSIGVATGSTLGIFALFNYGLEISLPIGDLIRKWIY